MVQVDCSGSFFFLFFLVCIIYEPILRVSECLFFFPISVPLVFPFLISSLLFLIQGFIQDILLGERGPNRNHLTSEIQNFSANNKLVVNKF